MFRKLWIAWMLLCILIVPCTLSFADDMVLENRVFTDKETANAIEVIAPTVNAEGNVSAEKEKLYLNIRLNQPVQVYFNLYKVDPQIFGVESIESKENSLRTDEIAVESAELSVETETIIPEILSEKDKKEFRLRIIDNYNDALNNLETLNETYLTLETKLKEAFGELSIESDLELLDYNQRRLLLERQQLLVEITAQKNEFNSIEAQYNQLFEKLIYGPEEIKVSSLIPHYTNEIEDIGSGKYKMVFYRDLEEQKAIKVMYFSIETSEETIEKIVETIDEDINNIWEIK